MPRVDVLLTPDEHAKLSARANAAGVSLAGLLRKGQGLPPLARGGAMPGAGRKPKRPLLNGTPQRDVEACPNRA